MSNQIIHDKGTELTMVIKNTLESRLSYGGGHAGWSRVWIVGGLVARGRLGIDMK